MTAFLSETLERHRRVVNAGLAHALERRIGAAASGGTLARAMRYAVDAGGKRLRPALVFGACELLGQEPRHALYAAVAVELIHTYSLIHDDLPAMDNADLRRGLPTVHREFGEGIAVLAGDALLTEAFAILAEGPETRQLPAERYLDVCLLFADAAGVRGMVRGQELDILHEGLPVSLETLQDIHHHKTAAMIRASVEAGAILGGADDETRKRLADFGNLIGLAFQIRDDLLDVSGDVATLGKQTGQDSAHGKATYPSLLGFEESRRFMDDLLSRAREILLPYGEKAAFLHELALHIGERRT